MEPGVPMEEKAQIDVTELADAWPLLELEDRVEGFRLLGADAAEEFFFGLDAHDQAEMLTALPSPERRRWIRLLPPDDAADLIQAAPDEFRAALMELLDDYTRKEVSALLAYAEDDAGGLMSSRYARLRPDMTADEAIAYLRRQAVSSIEPETIYYVYVLDSAQRLLGVLSFRDLFSAPGNRPVREIMHTDVISAPADMDQEALARLFSEHDLLAVPVVDENGVLKGIVTVDDIVDVVQEEATEDIQKIGGVQALDETYMRTTLFELVKKRAGWLAALFIGETLTASAVTFFEGELKQVLFLASFIPLIISSGGNSGSQASTLVIRAMAVEDVRLRDWWRVMRREFLAGGTLGLILGVIGFIRVVAWNFIKPYGAHYILVAFTIAFSVVGVVLWGALVGSMLPFLLRRLNVDPATASAPLVATLVDVTGIMIYFSVASFILRGTLLGTAMASSDMGRLALMGTRGVSALASQVAALAGIPH